MAIYSGKNGKLEVDNVSIGRVRSWAINSTVETLDVTDLGDDSRAYIAGLKGATGTLSLFYHDDNTQVKNVLDDCITTGTPGEARIELIWGTKKIQLDAILNSVNITCATGEVMTADVGFTMTRDYEIVVL